MDSPADRSLVLAIADSPWGPVRIVAGPQGLVAVAMLSTADGVRGGPRAAARWGRSRRSMRPPPGPARDLAARARDRVAAFLAGEPVALDDDPIDLGDRSAWDRLVLEGVRSIPRGEVASYGEVARRIGRTGAARAVGGVGRPQPGRPARPVPPGDRRRRVAGRLRRGGLGRARGGARRQARAARARGRAPRLTARVSAARHRRCELGGHAGRRTGHRVRARSQSGWMEADVSKQQRDRRRRRRPGAAGHRRRHHADRHRQRRRGPSLHERRPERPGRRSAPGRARTTRAEGLRAIPSDEADGKDVEGHLFHMGPDDRGRVLAEGPGQEPARGSLTRRSAT